jgi:hypothetical protein
MESARFALKRGRRTACPTRGKQMTYYHRWTYKVDPPPSRAIATVYVLAVVGIVLGLVWSYCNLFKPKPFENPGVSAYRAPPGTTTVHPLVSAELVPGLEEVVASGTETVGQSTRGSPAQSAMAFARGLPGRYKSKRASMAYLGKARPSSRAVVMTFSLGRLSHWPKRLR